VSNYTLSGTIRTLSLTTTYFHYVKPVRYKIKISQRHNVTVLNMKYGERGGAGFVESLRSKTGGPGLGFR
jgi:hypothetical protein